MFSSSTSLSPRYRTMAAAATTPGEFVEPGFRKEEYIDVNVGDQIVKVFIIGGATILGAAAMSEAKDVVWMP